LSFPEIDGDKNKLRAKNRLGSIRFRVIKEYVGLFEVARIWVALAPVELKGLPACAKVRWNLQGHVTVTIVRV
jgi:hypothetical protein